MDAAPHHQTMEDVLAIANDYELFILHTSIALFEERRRLRAEAIKAVVQKPSRSDRTHRSPRRDPSHRRL